MILDNLKPAVILGAVFDIDSVSEQKDLHVNTPRYCNTEYVIALR